MSKETSLAHLIGSEAPEPIYPTVTEAWLNVSQDPQLGIHFHKLEGPAEFQSYAKLLSASKGVAVALKALGVRPRERIAIVLPTGPEFLHIYFGAMLAEAIPAPLYPPMGLHGLKTYRQRTREMLHKLHPRLLVTMPRLKALLPALTEGLPDFLGIREPEQLQGSPAQFHTPQPNPLDIAFVQFSSGTTVQPKPVALSHRNLMANITAIGSRYREAEPIRRHNLSWLPLYHDMGLIGNVMVPIAWNCTNELLAPQDFVARPWLWLQLMSQTRAVFSCAPHFAYSLCLRRIREEHMAGVDLSEWRWALNGAEPIHPGLIEAFEERFARWGLQRGVIVPAYGLAEASLAVTIGREGRGLEAQTFEASALAQGVAQIATEGVRIASAGYPLLGTEVRIVDAEKSQEVLSQGIVGEIQVKNGAVMEGYLLPNGQVQPQESPWLSTGDLGFILNDQLFVSGRKKDLIIQNGRNLYPHYLEETLGRLPGIRLGNCAVVSRPGETTEEIFGFAEVSDEVWNAPASHEDLREQIRRLILEEHAVTMTHVILLEKYSLPRTSSGKIRRAFTLEAYLQGQLQSLRRPDYWETGKLLVQSGFTQLKRTLQRPS